MARKNVQDAFNAWNAGKTCRKSTSIWTDGSIIFSYNTPLLCRKDGVLTLNSGRYSVTTSCQQGGLRQLMAMNGMSWKECDL